MVKDQNHSSNKQRDYFFITLRHEVQSISIQQIFKFLQVQSQKQSAITKLALMRTATGKEDPEFPLLQRISQLELPASDIVAQINVSEFK